MRLHLTLAALLLATAPLTHAQTSAPSSPAKKELVQKILVAQQPGIEAMARQLAEQPASRLMQQAGVELQRVPAEKRDAVAKEIEADLRRYADEAVPIVRDRAVKLAPSTIGAILGDKFSEGELKELLSILESPVNRKYQSLSGEMQRALGEKLVADTRSLIEPKMQALQQTVAGRLGIAPAAAAPKPSAPAKK